MASFGGFAIKQSKRERGGRGREKVCPHNYHTLVPELELELEKLRRVK